MAHGDKRDGRKDSDEQAEECDAVLIRKREIVKDEKELGEKTQRRCG